jgi:hypothetical protein
MQHLKTRTQLVLISILSERILREKLTYSYYVSIIVKQNRYGSAWQTGNICTSYQRYLTYFMAKTWHFTWFEYVLHKRFGVGHEEIWFGLVGTTVTVLKSMLQAYLHVGQHMNIKLSMFSTCALMLGMPWFGLARLACGFIEILCSR